eukprot:11539101-Alexandrium_andersonii.AAC.1
MAALLSGCFWSRGVLGYLRGAAGFWLLLGDVAGLVGARPPPPRGVRGVDCADCRCLVAA